MIDYRMVYKHTSEISLLLVEDYKPLRDDMLEIFEEFVKSVTIASNGVEAIEIYEDNSSSFDIVVSDIQMPKMDGIELSRRIREIDPDQQIIILSAHTDSEYLLELINFGIAQFITKPIDHNRLLNTLYEVSKKITNNTPEDQNTTILDLGKGFTWDTEKLILKDSEKNIDLTSHELVLMRYFVIKKDQICTNDDIVYEFYEHNIDISEKNIRNLVFKLRKKLPNNIITSIYAMGYKFSVGHLLV
ncbi:response regulator receiver domain protein (CheY-like) [hydrothermal vent metagenome]|uniref:Response regulator receiver domain protein (CheY-like) n=1 Tax=hydrothermal vent metagenome TaxID=652676 RepID=A0A1W1CAU6_9ZZZZ